MHRQPLLNLLESYNTNEQDELTMLHQTIAFVNQHPNCFDRSLAIGHITASVLITDFKHKHVLMIHHAILSLWLQPGGHCDGDNNVKAVALKEAQEETGLKNFKFKSDEIFDVDIHEFPARKNIAAHLHYDIRFWLQAEIHFRKSLICVKMLGGVFCS